MNSQLADRIFPLKRYISFLYHAKTRYSVHSPYIFKLIADVIRPDSPPGICGPVELLRGDLKKDRRMVQKTDFGSGVERTGESSYQVSIRELARHSALPSYRAARLFNLVRYLKANHILELGTSLGISAAYMAKARSTAMVVTLEGCPNLSGLARENMMALGLKNVEVVPGQFKETLPGVLERMVKVDLVFFDGDHRYGPTVEYFNTCLQSAHNDTVFVFDDIHFSAGMEQAWKEIISHPGVTTSIDLFHMGMVFFRKEMTLQHFVLRYP